jgi:hypothetical protein
MEDLITCKVAREDFQQWLASGNGPVTIHSGEKADVLLTILEKTPSVDYLYRTSIAKDGGISWRNSLLFCGVYDGENHALYLAKDAQAIFTRGPVPLVTEPGGSMMEDICGKVNRRVEDIVANDRSNLPVQEVTGWLAAHNLEHYQKYGAQTDAIQMLFEGRAPDGKFHSGYAMEELPEAAFLAWLQDPEGFIQTEAEMYIKSNSEKLLQQFLENDALLAEYQALVQDTGSPIHRMKAITDALNGSSAKMVNVTVKKGGEELTFKMEASPMKGHHTYYSTYHIPAADRRRFQLVFGRNTGFKAEEVVRITYGRNTIYEAPPAQEETMAESAGPAMGGMM